MNTQELKERILEEVERTDSEDLLKAVLHVLWHGATAYRTTAGTLTFSPPYDDDGEEASAEEIHILSEWQKESIERGLKDMKEGRFFTHEEVMKRMEKYLK